MIEFIVYGEPRSKERARVVNGHAYTPKRTRDAEEVIRHFCRGPLIDGPCHVHVQFYCFNKRRRDLDNMTKLVLDALNGCAYHDDSQIVGLAASKHTAEERDNARTEVTIWGVAA